MSITIPAYLESLAERLGIELEPQDSQELLVREDYAQDDRKIRHFTLDGDRLIGLNLAGCSQLDTLEELDSAAYQHLEVLIAGRTPLRQLRIPTTMQQLRDLRLYECTQLEQIDLHDKLPALQYLDLSESALKNLHLPQGLNALEKLYLQKNQLQSLHWPAACPLLKLADLSENKLSNLDLPAGLAALRFLYLNDNQLNRLSSAGNLPALQVLHLRKNQLEELPLVFVQGQRMETLYLHGNPLSTLPQELIAKDERGSSLKEVRDYLLELNKKDNIIINDRAKLIIVGNGRVGKTSICKQLQGKSFDPNEAYTHGIQIGKLSKKDLPDIGTQSLQLNVWDFGGQEIFYATHQFFLSDEAIYLLAWTNEKNVLQHRQQSHLPSDEKWRSEEYWLDNIRLHGPNSPILMVQTHSDCREHKLLPDSNHQEAPFNAEFIDFSANKRFGLQELQAFIVDKLQTAVPMYGQSFPKTYERVIEQMEQSSTNFISMDEFVQVCQESGITAGTETTVLSYLHKSGVVVHFDRKGLADVVFTNPNWLTQQVYRLINNELASKNGRIDQAYLEKMLPDYSALERVRFVELLKTFKLIFAAGGEDQIYIAPQYLPTVLDSTTRDLYESHKEELQLAFVFRFPRFMPDNVMINFLSTYGPYSRKMYWRNGIFFKKDDQKCIVELEDKSNALWVYTHQSSFFTSHLKNEICAAFVELSKNTRAEISLDGQVFASWQELERQYELYERNQQHEFFAIDGTKPLLVRDFVWALERVEMSLQGLYVVKNKKETTAEKVEQDRDPLDVFSDHSDELDLPAIEPSSDTLKVPKGEDGKTKILFLSANPADQKNLALDREVKYVQVDAQGKALEIVPCPHIDRNSMINMVAFQKPQIVHFSGHGSDGGLAMIDPETNKTALVDEVDLVRMFTLFKKTGVRCVVLCSCWSFNQAKVISELGIPVVGMLRKIGDEEAIQFSRDLYYLLMSNNPLDLIFDLAKEKVNKSSRDIPSLWYQGKRIG